VFRIDQQTGGLTPTGHKIELGSPVCVKFIDRADR
jgi:6-phosphogluconolactonase (cycloisomerase 2 family)